MSSLYIWGDPHVISPVEVFSDISCLIHTYKLYMPKQNMTLRATKTQYILHYGNIVFVSAAITKYHRLNV